MLVRDFKGSARHKVTYLFSPQRPLIEKRIISEYKAGINESKQALMLTLLRVQPGRRDICPRDFYQ